MAINIDIPGVGRVQVEGVASEAVMEKILDQLKSMDPKNSSSPAADANKKAAKSAEEFEKALKSATPKSNVLASNRPKTSLIDACRWSR